MKIGIVCYPTFGGSGVVATELGKALAAKGHHVHFITYAQPVRLGSLRSNMFYHEVNVQDYPLFDYPPYELVLSSKLVDVVRYEKLDLLHVHYAIPHAMAALTAQRILADEDIRIPVVTTLHGTDITLVGRDESFEPVITYCINHSDAVTAVSDSLRNDTLALFNVTREVETIPNFVCLDKIKPNDSGEVSRFRQSIAPNGERILVHISNFRPVKRIADVVKVFARVREQIPAKLLLIGDGPDRTKIEHMCRDLGVCQDVKMLGKLKNPTEALHIADLFLLTSEKESFGLAALEAMAAGVPVVSSNAGGIPEVNAHGFSGYLADVGDIAAMADYAMQILEKDEALAVFKKQALQQARKFDIHLVLPRYEKLYKALLQPV